MKNLYLFGISNGNVPCIVKFDPISKNLIKMLVPEGMKVLNYMNCIYINENTIYLTGGINKGLNEIATEAKIYNPEAGTFQALPSMIQPRYTHFGVFFENKLYCFGGRYFGKGMVGILKACEYFDFNTWRWFEMCPMRKRRCTGNALVYGNEMYVFGGYTGDKERARMVELIPNRPTTRIVPSSSAIITRPVKAIDANVIFGDSQASATQEEWSFLSLLGNV